MGPQARPRPNAGYGQQAQSRARHLRHDICVWRRRAEDQKLWQRYEDELPQAIDTLVSGRPIPSNYVLEILVPFVAGLCVRSTMYDDWLAEEHGDDVRSHPDFTNLTRVALMEGLAGRIMRCEWVVVHAETDVRFIANDLGFTGGETGDGAGLMFIPLRPDAGL